VRARPTARSARLILASSITIATSHNATRTTESQVTTSAVITLEPACLSITMKKPTPKTKKLNKRAPAQMSPLPARRNFGCVAAPIINMLAGKAKPRERPTLMPATDVRHPVRIDSQRVLVETITLLVLFPVLKLLPSAPKGAYLISVLTVRSSRALSKLLLCQPQTKEKLSPRYTLLTSGSVASCSGWPWRKMRPSSMM